jgi:S1-C subfamily serine protease
VQAPGLHAGGSRAKTYARFKSGCDNGDGLSCYNYGRAMWSSHRRKEALKSLARGCELKYKLACASYHDHSVTTHRVSKRRKFPDGSGDICFTNNELNTAHFSPNELGQTGVHGQKIIGIKPGSFWDRTKLKENDIIVRVNNMPFNTSAEMLRAFSASGKTFGFEVLREGETTTIWYTCN